MSHAVRINYEGMSIECVSICDQSLQQLCKINTMVEWIEENASTLINDKVVEYKGYLLNTKDEIERQLESLKIVAKDVVTKQSLAYSGGTSRDIVTEANNLRHIVEDLTTKKLLVIEDLIDNEIKNKATRNQERFRNQCKGIIEITQEQMSQLATISDLTLRESVYYEMLKEDNQGLSFEELLDLGNKTLDERTEKVITKNIERIKNKIKDELKSSRVDQDTVEGIISQKGATVQQTLKQIRNLASQEIINESVRKETIKVIVKTIENRNFIVDRKNIKMNKEKNEVTVIAQKASGEKAEFKVYLDGKFLYKFDGYEGQSCQKDIEPFMDDLESIYGIKITSREEIWKNPDKISTMKYKSLNKNTTKQ